MREPPHADRTEYYTNPRKHGYLAKYPEFNPHTITRKFVDGVEVTEEGTAESK